MEGSPFPPCPNCHSSDQIAIHGFESLSRARRYRCKRCRRTFSLATAQTDLRQARRVEALRLYQEENLSLREIGKRLGVSYQTVHNWVLALSATDHPHPEPPNTEIATLATLAHEDQQKEEATIRAQRESVAALKYEAWKLYKEEGKGVTAIARKLGTNHQKISRWIKKMEQEEKGEIPTSYISI